MKLRHALFAIDTKYKKIEKYMEDESDIDDDWIIEHEEATQAKEIEKAEKKFAKENENFQEEGAKLQSDSILQQRIADIKAEFQRLAKERGTGKAVLKRERPVEKLEEAIEKITEKIKAFRLQIVDRDAGKEVALGTRSVFPF
jgi:DNA topoisomerase I